MELFEAVAQELRLGKRTRLSEALGADMSQTLSDITGVIQLLNDICGYARALKLPAFLCERK